MMEKRKLINKKDFLLIILLVIISIVFFVLYNYLNFSERVKAELVVDGKIIKEISLDKDMTFELEKNHNIVFEIKDKKIRFLRSDCPDKICVNTGFISKGGQSAVCLPNKVSLRITADNKDDEIDGIAQ